MANLRWYHIFSLVVGIVGVCFGPWLLIQPNPWGCESLDFSHSGSIGDTIGGITAPFIGLISIVLLVWTLNEQIKINNEQIKFNDASRMLTIQAHIMQIDESIHYGYSTSSHFQEGRGVATLHNLQKGTSSDVRIPYEVLISLIERVHVLDVSVKSIVNIACDSRVSEEEKKHTIFIALTYIEQIIQFYEMVKSHQIEYILPINELGNELIGLSSSREFLAAKTKLYLGPLRDAMNKCKKIIEE